MTKETNQIILQNKNWDSQQVKTPLGSLHIFHLKKNLSYLEILKECHKKEQDYVKEFKSESKKKEFIISRFLLRKNYFSQEDKPLLNKKTEGSILWPQGSTGSLSHKKNTFAFFVKKTSHEKKFYGIDIEEFSVTEKIFQRISTATEIGLVKNQPKQDKENFYWTLCFSIKEALFKSFAPHHGKSNLLLIHCIIEEINLKNSSFKGSYTHPKYGKTTAQGFFYQVQIPETKQNMILCFCG